MRRQMDLTMKCEMVAKATSSRDPALKILTTWMLPMPTLRRQLWYDLLPYQQLQEAPRWVCPK